MKKVLKYCLVILREFLEAFYALYLKYIVKKPIVINLNANDVCNSRCTMCNIWKQKKAFEMSPQEFGKVLKDPLYNKVKHVGITGGEPTLRDDLVEIYVQVIESLPSLKGVSIITNSIEHEVVIEKILRINQVCKDKGVQFSVMVSLDGVGEVHDQIRGIKGNFESSIKTINILKEKNIPVSIGCTISKNNVWGAEDLLYYLDKNKIYGRFRVAEFIERLYNQDRGSVIKNFDADETYQLMLFFKKLEMKFETRQLYKRTYQNIIAMLNGQKRQIGCPYQSNGLVLNSKGEVSYCAPRSPIIGDGLKESSQEIYEKNLEIRKSIRQNKCDGCIHDYHYYATFRNAFQTLKNFLFLVMYKSNSLALAKAFSFFASFGFKGQKELEDKIFITGWYGTETVGDKAILGGILDEYKAKGMNKFVVSSLHPFITVRTLAELGVEAEIVDVFSKKFLLYARYCKEMVMGGGPLMDIAELYLPYYSFAVAKQNKRKTVVFGCGLGPLKVKKYRDMVTKILRNSSTVMLRDYSSVKMAQEMLGVKTEFQMIGDPAKKYVAKKGASVSSEKTDVIRCFLREWTSEYAPANYTEQDYLNKKEEIEKKLVELILKARQDHSVEKVELCNMHNFIVGHDDRDFSRYFIDKYFKNCDWISYDNKLTDVDKTIHLMKTSRFNICMRFHSVVFAHTLNTEFWGVDYTMGGKIFNFLNDNKVQNKLISLN